MRLPGLTLPSKPQLATTLRYAAAGVVYVAVGVTFEDFLLSVFVAMAYLLAVIWLVPALVRRTR